MFSMNSEKNCCSWSYLQFEKLHTVWNGWISKYIVITPIVLIQWNNAVGFGFCGLFFLYFYRVGDSTPTIDRVKCYCRPSWEGTFDMKPYVSDYY